MIRFRFEHNRSSLQQQYRCSHPRSHLHPVPRTEVRRRIALCGSSGLHIRECSEARIGRLPSILAQTIPPDLYVSVVPNLISSEL